LKKVEIVTECGEKTNFYVEQDVETVTIDGEEWVKKPKSEQKEKTTVIFKTSEDDGIDPLGAGCAFKADFSNGVWIYANSNGRIEYLAPYTHGWEILHS
jgi:hypothetical protein